MSMKPNRDDLTLLDELLSAGKVVPLIDRRYPLLKRQKLSSISVDSKTVS